MGVAHVGLVHRDPCECKVKGFRAVSSIERNVSNRRHFQGVRHYQRYFQIEKISNWHHWYFNPWLWRRCIHTLRHFSLAMGLELQSHLYVSFSKLLESLLYVSPSCSSLTCKQMISLKHCCNLGNQFVEHQFHLQEDTLFVRILLLQMMCQWFFF